MNKGISEQQFATHFGYFWRDAFPFSEFFVRRINRDLTTQVLPPLPVVRNRAAAGVLAEAAFELFALRSQAPRSARGPNMDAAQRAVATAVARKYRFSSSAVEAFIASEWPRVSHGADRLGGLVRRAGLVEAETLIEPELPGLGLMRHVRPDIMSQEVLVEVKSVHRPFRTTDVRQVATYVASAMECGRPVQTAALANPALGTLVMCSIDSLFRGLGGVSAAEGVARISHFLYEMSREHGGASS